ncbi:MmpS family protein [Mycobacterium sp. E342]|uniref:MmpS family transport accessory protein n=1 Tax=unclassified Mycobacterium TaxID=2642494 RepID=UPI0008012EF0|nr:MULTISPECIES: MmpS family transport accessory protein [unclassified Mycobacterium]OBH16856.1 MmpS family protein [Mycobacterium sp. E3247]OBH32083.1 MmpS family protein [Mycobacterium sp. E342]
MFRTVKRAWIPLLLIVVVTLGGYVVVRIRDTFGVNGVTPVGEANADNTKPFNPKHITYEITSATGGNVNVNYLDENGQPHLVDSAPLPWSYTIVTTLPSMSANIVAQGSSQVNAIRCRVIVDGQVRDDRRSDEYQPFIYCLVKAV